MTGCTPAAPKAEAVSSTNSVGEQQASVTDFKPTDAFVTVTKVVDGDTVDVLINGKTERVRLLGINTPETVDPRKTVECFGKEASAKTKELLNGKDVKLESDPSQGDRDKYQRLLRYIFLADGTNVNLALVQQGYAYEYTYDIPYKFQSEFKQAQRDAETSKRGLWADNACQAKTEKLAPIPTPVPTPASTIPAQPLSTPTPSTPKPTEPSTTVGDCSCSGNSYNCTNFQTHQQAQNLYACCLQKTGTDIHRLDADHDGLACETLP